MKNVPPWLQNQSYNAVGGTDRCYVLRHKQNCGMSVELLNAKFVNKFGNNSALNPQAEIYIRIIRIFTPYIKPTLLEISN